MLTIESFASDLGSYLETDQVDQVVKAYHFASEAHEGQKRKSGEPYITHPLAVANILAEMHMDHQSLMAAMLHVVSGLAVVFNSARLVRCGEEIEREEADGLAADHSPGLNPRPGAETA